MKSESTSEEAIRLIKSTKALGEKGGFKLHKFVSNAKAVIDSISLQDHTKGLQSLDVAKDILPVERPLGVHWCVESDTFHFRVEMKDQPLSKRGVLSTISSVFDPLGLLAPLILVRKVILRELCRDRAEIARCYKAEEFGEFKSVEFQHFSDGSKYAYGQCSYLRLINHCNQVHCYFVMAKSHVAPLKPITTPCLELTPALLSVKISNVLQRELEYDQLTEVFWTDSNVLIAHISNEAPRLHVFVANRV